ncbi:Hypothetical Protein FCC1311_102612 [Hondaea fermentalgiana]|uniref:Uncharacterized protein n=1 Tax=Hondaea fermentalgiana TaxID=2315210 RepID=A0A2R5GW92_9STRA|nr:Hypothetical Protein FCC1311_102612 [Hondaea fermentalgiana]|eukprot:GBG34038.1 Hypothetical Protein FCC1311_102612 [Hondaea fermentalgiana]
MMILVGLGIVGVSAYLVNEQYKHKILGTDEYLRWAVWIPFCVGWVIVIMAAIACCVAITENRCCLGFFGFLQILCTILVIFTGIFMMVFDHYSDLTAHTGVGDLKSGLGNSLHLLYDYQLGVYEGCCGSLVPAPENCTDPIPDGIFDYCILQESNDAYLAGYESDDSFCDALNNEDALNWCAGAEGALSDAPTAAPSKAPTTASPTLEPTTLSPTTALGENETYAPTTLEPTAAPTLEPTTESPTASEYNPAGDDFHSFQVAWYNYSHAFLFPVGIAFLCFGFITFLTSIISCCLACRKKRDDGDYEKVGATAAASKKNKEKEAEMTALKKDAETGDAEKESLTMT